MEDSKNQNDQKSLEDLLNLEASRTKNTSLQNSFIKQDRPSQVGSLLKSGIHHDNINRQSTSTKTRDFTSNDLKATNRILKCSGHPEEDLQFYCFNENRLLCAECVVSNICGGHQVINFKRASVRIKRKIDEMLCEMESKVNAYTLWEKKIECNRDDFSEIIQGYKDQIATCISDLKKKIDAKQEELMQKADRIFEYKAQEFDISLGLVSNLKGELQSIKDIVENNMKTLDEVNICDYYSKKMDILKALLNDENSSIRAQEIHFLVDNKNFQDQVNLKRFQEELETAATYISTITGIEEVQIGLEATQYLSSEPGQSPTTNEKRKSNKSPIPLQSQRLRYQSLSLSNQIDSLYKLNKPGSPSRSISYKALSPEARYTEEEINGSLHARSQYIHKLLDRIFDARNKKMEKINEDIDFESNKLVEETNPVKITKQNVLRASINDEERRRENFLPVGHSVAYEKNKLFRTTFIPDLTPSSIRSENRLGSSPNLQVSESPQYSGLLSQVQSSKGFRSSFKEAMQSVTSNQRLGTPRAHAAIRSNSSKKISSVNRGTFNGTFLS